MNWILWLGMAQLAAWLVLVFRWHGFWRMGDADFHLPPAPALPPGGKWPEVVAVIPARNEADNITRALASVLGQDYPGRLKVIVVNDNSDDDTARLAGRLAEGDGRLTVLDAPPKPDGWAGKVAAMDFGVAHALKNHEPGGSGPEYFWFTDADIVHPPEMLRKLVKKALTEKLGLTSVMVRLSTGSFWEKLLVPAFVYYFFLLYPPRAVSRPDAYAAGAAGGCMLLRREALADIGGMAAIRDAVIDDCSLARKVKDRGWRLWLGLDARARSLRPYENLGDFWRMVERSAYEQLHHSPLLLVLSLAGMGFAFVLPALYALGFVFGQPWPHFPGLVAFGLMSASYLPAVRHHGLAKRWALTLPAGAVLMSLMTLTSAINHMSGRGVQWRGRRGD